MVSYIILIDLAVVLMNKEPVFLLLVFIYGLLIGSFLNVCIYRIPLGKTVVKGRSYCPACGSLISWYMNIPLISFLLLRGKCHNCKLPISLRYPAVELLTALVFVTVWFKYGFSLEAIFVLILFLILIIISFIDFDHQIIPDGLVIIIAFLGFMHLVYELFMGELLWYSPLSGVFAASLILVILGSIIPNSIGGGDIKLMAASGFFVGGKLILLSLFIGAVYASIFSLFMVAFKKSSFKTAIPFGPFLSLGIATSVLTGERLINWYITMFILL